MAHSGIVRGHGISGFAAVVLAGGAATRMGGAAKPAVPVGGSPLLSRVLTAVALAHPRVVVGPAALDPLLPPGVRRTVEEPPGGGPVAALAAGLRLVPADVEFVAVLAADLPFLTPAVLATLTAQVDGEAAVLLDDRQRPQWLCSVWRRAALAARIPSAPAGQAMRALTEGAAISLVSLTEPNQAPAWFDCDTDGDIRRAEEWARGDAR